MRIQHIKRHSSPSSPTSTDLRVRNGILVVPGYGLRISVQHGRLQIRNSLTGIESTADLARATSGLRRLVVIGHTGFITFDALRWLSDVGVAFAQIDADGRLIASFSPAGSQDVRLKRAQAVAVGTEQGLEIVRALLREKIRGQCGLLRALNAPLPAPLEAISTIEKALDDLESATGLEHLSWLEALAASAYWTTVAVIPVRFPEASRPQVPAHWLTVGSRASPISGRAHNAASPAQAILNYCYAVLENEARIALLSAGLDPEMGLLHTDRRFRNSFALDVLEPVRPDVDAFVLGIIRAQVLSPRDFVETRIGVCRLAPELARRLAHTAPLWAARLQQVIPTIVRMLSTQREAPVERSGSQVQPPSVTALRRVTKSNTRGTVDVRPAAICVTCGAPVRHGVRNCTGCEATRQIAWAGQLSKFSAASAARRRAAGVGLRVSPMAKARRVAKISANQQAARSWRSGAPRVGADAERFRTEILPLIQGLSLREMSDATGVSNTWWSQVKRGLRVPQERHWRILVELASSGYGTAASKPQGEVDGVVGPNPA